LERNASRRGVIVLAAAIAGLSLASCAGRRAADEPGQVDSATSSPIYYVDGAMPSPGAENSDNNEGCVQWSKDRPDVWVCAPLPDANFSPPPPPGDATDYPEVCEVAAQILKQNAKSLMDVYALQSLPAIDVSSCRASGIGNAREGRWMAKFWLETPVTSVTDAQVFVAAEIHNFTLEGRQGGIILSSEAVQTP